MEKKQNSIGSQNQISTRGNTSFDCINWQINNLLPYFGKYQDWKKLMKSLHLKSRLFWIKNKDKLINLARETNWSFDKEQVNQLMNKFQIKHEFNEKTSLVIANQRSWALDFIREAKYFRLSPYAEFSCFNLDDLSMKDTEDLREFFYYSNYHKIHDIFLGATKMSKFVTEKVILFKASIGDKYPTN